MKPLRNQIVEIVTQMIEGKNYLSYSDSRNYFPITNFVAETGILFIYLYARSFFP